MVAVAIVMPSAWTTATLAFQTSAYGSYERSIRDPLGAEYRSAYEPVYADTGSDLVIQVAVGRVVTLATAGLQSAVMPLRWVKLVSGWSAAPVAQAAARTLYVIGKSNV
jgi:hypothetical protein